MTNQSENEKFNNAVRDAGLTRDQAQQMHQDLQKDPAKDGKSYEELRRMAEDYK